jgi:hypothetical protein
MDRLAEAVAAYLCRHRSVGLFRLTLDLTRRRLDLFAKIGAVEVVRDAVAPPTPGTDTWWRVAVREAVYAPRERGLVQYVNEAEVVNWRGLLTTRARHYCPAQLRGRYFPPFFLFLRGRTASLPNAVRNVKQSPKPTAKKTKTT